MIRLNDWTLYDSLKKVDALHCWHEDVKHRNLSLRIQLKTYTLLRIRIADGMLCVLA